MRKLIRDFYLNVMGTLKSGGRGIHILNLHYVTKEIPSAIDRSVFENFIKHLQCLGEVISINDAVTAISNGNVDTPLKIALTFDDGFEECHSVIAPVLDHYGIKAGFFINVNYVESSQEYQTKFNNRIKTFTKTPMSWAQIIDLHKNGHVIGSHTLDHYNMSELTVKDLRCQLEKNKEVLELNLNYVCDYFAWPYGQMNDFPEQALLETEKLHSYIFSGTNYKSYFTNDKRILNRRHVEPFWSKNHITYFLSSLKN